MIRRGFGARSVARTETLRVASAERSVPIEIEELRSIRDIPPGRRVLVIGAGMAGLCAAYELQMLGFEITVLEADQSHAGGRVRTLRFGDRSGEAGAMRIPRDHNLTRFYCGELQLGLRPFVQVNDQAFLRVRGRKVLMKDAPSLRDLFELGADEALLTDLQLWQRAIGAITARLSRPEQNDLFSPSPGFLGSSRLDENSLHGRLLEAGLSEGAIQLLASTWNLETSVHFALCEHLREELEGVWIEPFDEIVGGMDTLPKTLASRLSQPVTFGAPVIAIEQDGPGVTAVVNAGDGNRTFTADWLICTVPLGVLTRIKYRPGWSHRKSDAIRRVNYDDSTKVLALAKSRFWELDDGIFGGGSVSDGTLGSTWYPSDNAENKSADVSRSPSIFLASYSWGQTARRMARNAGPQTVIPELATLHGRLVTEPDQIEHLETWAWGDHPWSVGAYSFYYPGDQTELHDALVAPEGKVLLAGEHASMHHSWIQGGIESGLRAATFIAQEEAP
ncbi:FAD-dependent oxidoreductase [Bradyrhizobium liaoningense]|uniref:flavin monoamine oxidase family protein n=1 Tax=Bradyrhizobium liaoningense TaxID=43992 RepID=UPI001BA9FE8F|nr:FAD-dependent oxidoreductase [Bradyrhizobium liaoningense]MBR1033213.1 FAD-dependent oxidoreductase [Bradyrhizobium liaoningense]